jgi:hypothetical protein
MLEVLLASRGYSATVEDLERGMHIEGITFAKQAVMDAASDLRAALRGAVKSAGLICENPLPSMDRGRNLAYRLDLP